MDRRMYRYLVPADGEVHTMPLSDDPVAVAASSDSRAVEFWAEYHDSAVGVRERSFLVFGTGQPLPVEAKHIGTCPRTALGLVWHLYEVPVR